MTGGHWRRTCRRVQTDPSSSLHATETWLQADWEPPKHDRSWADDRTGGSYLLRKRLGSFSNEDVAADLVRALDYIPLAISQAAAYIQAREPRSSLQKYLAEFRESERKKAWLLGHDAGDLRRDRGASNAILTTWQSPLTTSVLRVHLRRTYSLL